MLSAVMFLLLIGGCGQAPDYHTADGKSGNWADFHGQWLFINYWAEWCKPCVKEIPVLNAFNEAHSNVQVLGINFDGLAGQDLNAAIEKFDIRYPSLSNDPAAQFGEQRPAALPSTLVINPGGKLHTVLLGEQDKASLEAVIAGQ